MTLTISWRTASCHCIYRQRFLTTLLYMQEAQSHTTQRACCIVLLPQLQIGIMWKGIMCSIKGNLHALLAGRPRLPLPTQLPWPSLLTIGAICKPCQGDAPLSLSLSLSLLPHHHPISYIWWFLNNQAHI